MSIWDWTSAFAFYPRSPRGERRKRCLPHSLKAGLSIHALREESDRTVETLLIPLGELSIHALREESDSHGTARIGVELCLSIHALREESDNIWLCMRGIIANFLSTLSARRATYDSFIREFRLGKLSIHALREESDSFPMMVLD